LAQTNLANNPLEKKLSPAYSSQFQFLWAIWKRLTKTITLYRSFELNSRAGGSEVNIGKSNFHVTFLNEKPRPNCIYIGSFLVSLRKIIVGLSVLMGECFKEREGIPKQVHHISPIHKGISNTNWSNQCFLDLKIMILTMQSTSGNINGPTFRRIK
jgi:hypothetical protein